MHSCALLFALLCQQDNAEQYWKFKKGTKWEFSQTDGDKTKKKTLMEITEDPTDKRASFSSVDIPEGATEPEKTESMAYLIVDGYLTLVEVKEGKDETVFTLLKLGSKKGDKWKGAMPGGAGTETDVENLGTEDVTVGKETYKNALHCRMTFGDKDQGMEGVCDYYMAPGVGLIRFAMKMTMGSDMNKQTNEFKMELVKFTPAK